MSDAVEIERLKVIREITLGESDEKTELRAQIEAMRRCPCGTPEGGLHTATCHVVALEARLKEAEELLRRAAGRPWNPASKDLDKDIAAFLRGAK